jgi:Amt family ammonium transporter
MMTAPGLALFYGGLVRGKNVLSILMQCFVTLALVSVTWVLWGYSLAFGPDHGGLIGDLSWFGLRGVGLEPGPYADTIPHQAFMVFQLMFAAITPALIVGAFAERMKFSSFLAFVLLWSTFIYAPLALGRGMARSPGRPRLRRWHGGPHLLRHVCTRRSRRHRQAARARPGADAAP